MRKLRKLLLIIIVIVSVLLLTSCSPKSKIDLGPDMPVWTIKGPKYDTTLPDDAASRYITQTYKTETDAPNVYVYTYPKESMTLEEIGNAQASEYSVFCNMITNQGRPCANFIHRYDEGNDVFIAQNYMYEASDSFVKLTFLHKTAEKSIDESGVTIRMMKEYTEEQVAVDFAAFACRYKTDSEMLPDVGIFEFPKSGLTPEDYIEEYRGRYDLLKGEIIHRNDVDAAFIGYIDNGIFSVRALIENGDNYIMLTADDKAERFQHVVNALIDTISGVSN